MFCQKQSEHSQYLPNRIEISCYFIILLLSFIMNTISFEKFFLLVLPKLILLTSDQWLTRYQISEPEWLMDSSQHIDF